MKKAIVFGASGLVGSELLEILLTENIYDKIVLFNRYALGYNSSKVNEYIVNFDELDNFSDKIKGDIVFCTLGTTIRKAKTIENFRKVDFEIPMKIAQIARKNEVHTFVLVSSIGANKESRNYYTRTKGQIENELQKLTFQRLVIVRPSILLGKRKEFRFFELLGKGVMRCIGFLFFGRFKKYRAIHAKDVAKAMLKLVSVAEEKTVYESDELKAVVNDNNGL